jgi:hypothetical protein
VEEVKDQEHPLLDKEGARGSNAMGRFTRSIKILAKTEHPVFVRMREANSPIPVDPRAFFPWAEAQVKPARYRLMSVFRDLVSSERYSREIVALEAHYHDLAGSITRPMPQTSVDGARRNLEKIEQQRQERQAQNEKPNRVRVGASRV